MFLLCFRLFGLWISFTVGLHASRCQPFLKKNTRSLRQLAVFRWTILQPQAGTQTQNNPGSTAHVRPIRPCSEKGSSSRLKEQCQDALPLQRPPCKNKNCVPKQQLIAAKMWTEECHTNIFYRWWFWCLSKAAMAVDSDTASHATVVLKYRCKACCQALPAWSVAENAEGTGFQNVIKIIKYHVFVGTKHRLRSGSKLLNSCPGAS